MTEITNIKMLSPHLQKMLNAYGVTPERDPEIARRTRARFIAELDDIFVGQTPPKPAVEWFAFTTWISHLARLTNGLTPIIGNRVILYMLVTLVVFGVFLFSSVGITVYAASLSLPGDVTYPLKTTMENTRAWLTIDSAVRSRLYVDFAGRRLSEIQTLLDQRRYTDIAQAENEFEWDIQKALGAVESLSQADPAQAVALKAEVATALRGYRNDLTQMLPSAPTEIQPVLQKAINAAHSAVGGGKDDDGTGDDNGDGGRIPVSPTTTPIIRTPIPDSSVTPGKIPGRGDDDDNTDGSSSGGDDDDGGGDDDDDDGDNDGGDD